jgi:hypothetical protein
MSAPRFLANNSSRLHLRGGLRASLSRAPKAWHLRVASTALRLLCGAHPLQRSHLSAHPTPP